MEAKRRQHLLTIEADKPGYSEPMHPERRCGMYNGSSNWFDIELQFGRHAELLKEAEIARLVKSTRVRQGTYLVLLEAFLGYLGTLMVYWGMRLEVRAGKRTQVTLEKLCC